MKKSFALLILFVLLFASNNCVYADSSENIFQKMNTGSKTAICEDIFSSVCTVTIDHYKTSNFAKEFGDPFLLSAKCFFDTQSSTLFINVSSSFHKLPATTSDDYYFKITGDDEFEQLFEAPYTVNDDDWINIFLHDEKECYSTALDFLKQQRWKDPSSLTVYSYTATYGIGTYTFMVDYSAKNGFGGNTRSIYFIDVDATTNTVTSAFSS